MAKLTEAEIKSLNQRRIADNNREKAEQRSAQEIASDGAAWYHFLYQHSGVRAEAINGSTGTKPGAFHNCQANVGLMESFIAESGDVISLESLENAFYALRDRLAKSTETYERQTDTQKSMMLPQRRFSNLGAPPNLCPYTRSEIRSWSTEQLKRGIRQFGVDEINRILNNN